MMFLKITADAWFLWVALGALALFFGAAELGFWLIFGAAVLVFISKFVLPPGK